MSLQGPPRPRYGRRPRGSAAALPWDWPPTAPRLPSIIAAMQTLPHASSMKSRPWAARRMLSRRRWTRSMKSGRWWWRSARRWARSAFWSTMPALPAAANRPPTPTRRRWKRVVRVHAFGPHYLSKFVIPMMRQLDRGDIVMISSVATQTYGAFGAPYSMGKAAMEAFGLDPGEGGAPTQYPHQRGGAAIGRDRHGPPPGQGPGRYRGSARAR